ncbi:MAG: hypothetical protein AMXMBFR33_15110 [Candidatus Xenobia bacterium]
MILTATSSAAAGWTRQTAANQATDEASAPIPADQVTGQVEAPPAKADPNAWMKEAKDLGKSALPWAIGAGLALGAAGAALGTMGGPVGTVVGWLAGKTVATVVTLGAAALAGAYTYHRHGPGSGQIFYTAVATLGGLVGGALLSGFAAPLVGAHMASSGGVTGAIAGLLAGAPTGALVGGKLKIGYELVKHPEKYPEISKGISESSRRREASGS